MKFISTGSGIFNNISLPGSEYGLEINETKATDAKLFVSRYSLTEFVKSFVPPNPIIAEVGVFHGYFSEYIYKLFSPSTMFLIDTFNTHDFITNFFNKETHFQFIQNKFSSRSEVKCLQGLSWDMLSMLGDNSLDYIYIDADHSYESVKKDIAAAYEKIKNKGVIHFNDYCNYSILEGGTYGVMQAVNEFLREKNVRILGMSLDKSGYHDLAVQVFKTPMISIVTPCSRPNNLEKIKSTIQFDLIDKWYIIYDTRNQDFIKRFNDPKIIELSCSDDGIVGHPIRNMSLNIINEGLVYYLDDDNVIHSEFWNICPNFLPGHIYLFDQDRKGVLLRGNNPTVANIDTAQYVFDVTLVKGLRFNVNAYDGDGIFIETLCKNNPSVIVYINKICCYYNFLS
jgi:hypothetical protein